MVAALLTYERIRTTTVKAKEIRRLSERAITLARRLGPILTKKPEKRTDEEKARVVHAMRLALRVVRDRDAVLKLFEEIAPRFLARHGGYTRIMKIGQRPGDAAPMSILELLPDENAAAEKESKPASKTAKEGKGKKEPAEGKAKEAGEAKPKAKSKSAAEPKVKKAAGAKGPAKSAATMKRSSRGRGGE
jgi:large subunit ribosomal protein L17